MQSNPRGQPKLKIESSTRRELSAFDIVALAQDSYSSGVIAKVSVTTKNVKTKKKEKVHGLLVRYVIVSCCLLYCLTLALACDRVTSLNH